MPGRFSLQICGRSFSVIRRHRVRNGVCFNFLKLTSQKHRVQKVSFELSSLCHGATDNCCRCCRENEVEKPVRVTLDWYMCQCEKFVSNKPIAFSSKSKGVPE